jgi:hypothetical protein
MEREARSIQAEFPADSPEFRWPNQTCMGNRDGVQGTVEFARPEVQKFPQFGKVRMQVVKSPRHSFARCPDDRASDREY